MRGHSTRSLIPECVLRFYWWLMRTLGGVLAVLGIAAPVAAQRATRAPVPAPFSNGVVAESWGMNEGLPLNSVNHLLQTRDGYVWAATYDGLVRFNGVKFTVFNSANSPGLASSSIMFLHEGASGDLWMITAQGHLIRRRNGRFTVVADQKVVTDLSYPILTSADGTTWVGTVNGLARVDGDSLLPVRRDLVRDAVVALLLRRDGTLLAGASRGALLRLRIDRRGHETQVLTVADTALAHVRITAMYEAPNATLWLGSRDGVWTGDSAWRRVPAASGPDFLIVNTIVGAPDSSGVVILAQQAGQLPDRTLPFHVAIATSNGRVVTLRHVTDVGAVPLHLVSTASATWYSTGATLYRNGVPLITLGGRTGRDSVSFGIKTVLVDREGSIWLGTYLSGLHRIKPALARTISEPEGLRARNETGTYVDRSGAVWTGTWADGVSRIDPISGRVQGFGPETQSPPAGNVFFEARDGTFWMGRSINDTSLYRCTRGRTLSCIEEHPVAGRLRGVLAIDEDADGRLWVGAVTGAFRRDRDRLVQLDTLAGAPKVPVRAFATSRDGAIWMGTNGGGVVRYQEGVFTTITTKDGLPSNLIRALHVDQDGWLWVGTEGQGIARLDPRAWGSRSDVSARRRISSISSREGLFDDATQQILEDAAGRLWISSNRGIFWIAREEANAVADGRSSRVHSTGYTEREGMRNREANGGVQPSGAKGLDGRLWFPTADGVVVIDPRTIVSDTVTPPVVIERVVAGDSALVVTEQGVHLSPSQRDIRIEFTALTFLEPRNVRFRYRLVGYNDDWVDGDTRRDAFYTKLPPGDYTFRVEGTSGGEWHKPGASITIAVVPRFFETTWFRIAAIAAMTALLIGALQHRIRGARRRARELERVVADRTTALREREHQLELQNRQLEDQAIALQQLDHARSRFFANVSHELRTPLTLMIAPLDRLRERKPTDSQSRLWLDLAQRNARRLLELVNQILDVAKLEAGVLHLAPRRLELCSLLRGTLDSFRLTAERKNLRMTLDLPDECYVVLDPDAVEKIVTNLLSNAIKFTPPDGRIALRLHRLRLSVALTVVNTGPAIPLEQLPLLFERFYQVDESSTTIQPGTGIGLSLVKELVELQHGAVQATSTDEATTFTVDLPVEEQQVENLRDVTPNHASPQQSDDTPLTNDSAEDDVPTLLVVDDSEDMRTFIRAHFEDRFRVLEAGNGADGLDVARARLPDVIVSDVMMPVLDGRAMVRALRDSVETEYLAIVLLTAQAEDDQRISGLEGGADDYLVKPFEMRELDVRVRNLIAARKRLRTKYTAAASLPPSSLTALQPSFRAPTAAPVSDAVPRDDRTSLSDDDIAYRGRVLAAIAAHLGDAEFGVAELADAVFQDRSHLFRRVRQVVGQPPSDLIRHLRVEEAARLLRERSGSVADVAFSVGFRSVSHFFRCFHEQYGVTPAEYRASGSEARRSDPQHVGANERDQVAGTGTDVSTQGAASIR